MSARWGIVYNRTDEVGRWVTDRTGGQWWPGCGAAIGFTFDERLAAGITYSYHNGANIYLGFAVDDRRVFNRASLWAAFDYPFNHLGCRRVTAVCDRGNLRSIALLEHLGFACEATLKDAAPDGDQLQFRLLKSECRWILNNRYSPKLKAA